MKKGIITILTIFVITIMVSDASSLNIVQKNDEKTFGSTLDENYVDPNIKITKKHLPILKASLKFIKKDEDKCFVEKIIDLVKKKGKVESSDIESILIQQGEKKVDVYWGADVSGSAGYGSSASGFPFIWILTVMFWIGPSLYVRWGAYEMGYTTDWVDFVVDDNRRPVRYEQEHSGFALISPWGMWSSCVGSDGKLPGSSCTVELKNCLLVKVKYTID